MSVKSQIACPDCGSPIYIESTLLLAGQSFNCTNEQCSVSISLSSSETQRVSDAYQKFEDIRDQAKAQANQGG